jgi:hypothetical protein
MPACQVKADPEFDERIGKARAVHVGRQSRRMRHRGQRGDLGDAIEGARLGRLRQRQRRARHLADDPARKAFQRFGEDSRRHLAARPAEADELAAAGEEFGCAGFIIDHMSLFVAEDAGARSRDGGQRQRIGGRAT